MASQCFFDIKLQLIIELLHFFFFFETRWSMSTRCGAEYVAQHKQEDGHVLLRLSVAKNGISFPDSFNFH